MMLLTDLGIADFYGFLRVAKKSTIKKLGRRFWFWLAVAAATVIFALLLYSRPFRDTVEAAIVWTKEIMSLYPVLGAVVFFLFATLSAMLSFTSSAALVPSANLVWGKFVTFLLLWGGWITGAIIAFGIGRFARPLLVRLGYQKTFDKYKQVVSKRMKFWLVLLVCMALPSEIPGYLFGGIHYSFWKFLAAVAMAESIYAMGLVLAGENLLTARPLTLLIIATVLILIVAGAGFLLRKIKERKSTGNAS